MSAKSNVVDIDYTPTVFPSLKYASIERQIELLRSLDKSKYYQKAFLSVTSLRIPPLRHRGDEQYEGIMLFPSGEIATVQATFDEYSAIWDYRMKDVVASVTVLARVTKRAINSLLTELQQLEMNVEEIPLKTAVKPTQTIKKPLKTTSKILSKKLPIKENQLELTIDYNIFKDSTLWSVTSNRKLLKSNYQLQNNNYTVLTNLFNNCNDYLRQHRVVLKINRDDPTQSPMLVIFGPDCTCSIKFASNFFTQKKAKEIASFFSSRLNEVDVNVDYLDRLNRDALAFRDNLLAK